MSRAGPGARLRLLLAALAIGLLSGCATTDPRDPFEPFNRKVYAFNTAVDDAVLKPVATTYRDVVPSLARRGVSNFFLNLRDAWTAVNSFLQLKIEAGAVSTLRFSFNTVFGLAGLLDIASEAGMPRYDEDFGQTLAHWGVGSGPYIVLPLLGPSTLRDTTALPLDMAASSYAFRNDSQTAGGLTGLRVIDTRANLLGATRMLGDVALDPYLFVRDAYLQRRLYQIHDGNPPERAEDAYDDSEYSPDDSAQPDRPPAGSVSK